MKISKTKTENNSLTIYGIDYSMNGPAMCRHVGDVWNLSNCRFFYLTSKKKGHINDGTFFGIGFEDYLTPEERFDKISDFFLCSIDPIHRVYIENYSFNSTGKVFQIGENTGNLKHKLFKNNNEIRLISPGSVKKVATGRGIKVDKKQMHEAFVKETNFHIDTYFGIIAGNSPIADLVDAYYICKAGFLHITDPNCKIKIS